MWRGCAPATWFASSHSVRQGASSGRACNSIVMKFLGRQGIHDRPKSVQQMMKELDSLQQMLYFASHRGVGLDSNSVCEGDSRDCRNESCCVVKPRQLNLQE